jgi:hypothetical protein
MNRRDMFKLAALAPLARGASASLEALQAEFKCLNSKVASLTLDLHKRLPKMSSRIDDIENRVEEIGKNQKVLAGLVCVAFLFG